MRELTLFFVVVKFIFNYVYVHVSVGAPRGHKRALMYPGAVVRGL